ncbi:MAG: hypothetical protein HC860_24015 [Alkalinema sp. RU_4_3]|nr:hypothetical protein [Alkalinema sp. RU_4_3]
MSLQALATARMSFGSLGSHLKAIEIGDRFSFYCLYIHCAAGRSRSAMTVAAILLRKGICQTPQESIDYIHARRPCIELTNEQKYFLDKWFDQDCH